MTTKIVCTSVLLMILVAIVTHAQAPPPFGFDRWGVVIGTLEAYIPTAWFNYYYNRNMAENPGADAWTSVIVAAARLRQAEETNTTNAIHELCDHDPAFCAAIFSRHGLRWKDDSK